MKRLSIVVPIYGVEKYIHKFLTTLTPNLHEDVEVILVDDGSKDNCGKIIDEYAAEHEGLVSVIHKPNGGVSSARNVGMEKAFGEYLIFFDPDDYIADDFTTTIFHAIEKYNRPDVILYDYYDVLPNGEKRLKNIPMFAEGLVDKRVFLAEFLKDEYIMSTLWCKVIKREFFKGLTFREDVRVLEDALILTDVMLRIKSVIYLKKTLYYYGVRMNSLTKSMNIDDAKKCFEIALYRYNKYKDLFGDISMCMPVKFGYGVLQRAYMDNIDMDTLPYEQFIKVNISRILVASEFSLNRKKQCLLVYLGISKKYNQWKYRKKNIHD